MKKYQIFFLLVSIIGISSLRFSPALAVEKGIQLDEGVDTSKVLQDLKKKVDEEKLPGPAGRPATLLRLSDSLIKPNFLLKKKLAVPPYMYGHWQQFILNDAYRPAALERLPLIEALPSDLRDPLKLKWADIESVRAKLLTAAASLEAVDKTLYSDAVVLDQNAENLEKQGELLRQEVRDFNDACVDRPLPPDQHQRCLRWQADLKARIGLYNQKVERHNLQVEAWKKRAGEVQDKGDVISGKTREWSASIGAFILLADNAIDGNKANRVTVQAQGKMPPVEKSVSVITANPLCKEAGLAMLDELWEKLTTSERAERDEAIDKARNWIRGCPAAGVSAPIDQQFYNRNPRDPQARIDIVVHKGTAFVTCPCCSK